MSKMFTIAGTSTLNGVNTFRFATGKLKVREGVLRRGKHTDIKLEELPKAMTKDAAIKFLTDKGVTAVVPVGRKSKTVDEVAAAAAAKKAKEAAKKKAEKNERAKAARAAKKAEKVQGTPAAPLVNDGAAMLETAAAGADVVIAAATLEEQVQATIEDRPKLAGQEAEVEQALIEAMHEQ